MLLYPEPGVSIPEHSLSVRGADPELRGAVQGGSIREPEMAAAGSSKQPTSWPSSTKARYEPMNMYTIAHLACQRPQCAQSATSYYQGPSDWMSVH